METLYYLYDRKIREGEHVFFDTVYVTVHGDYEIEADYLVEIIDALGQTTSLDFSISYYGSVFDSDNFESYSEDSLLFTQSNKWVSFCNDSFAANISSNLPAEGLQYLESYLHRQEL